MHALGESWLEKRGLSSQDYQATLWCHARGGRDRVDELGSSDLIGDSVTLRAYYYGIFRDGLSNRGTPRTKATIDSYGLRHGDQARLD